MVPAWFPFPMVSLPLNRITLIYIYSSRFLEHLHCLLDYNSLRIPWVGGSSEVVPEAHQTAAARAGLEGKPAGRMARSAPAQTGDETTQAHQGQLSDSCLPNPDRLPGDRAFGL